MRTLYAYSGGLAELIDLKTYEVRFSAEKIAQEAFEMHQREPRSSRRLWNIANSWGEQIKPVADAMLKQYGSKDYLNDMGWGVFGGLDEEGAPLFMVANIGVTVEADHSAHSVFTIERIPKNTPSALTLNQYAKVIKEFMDAQTPRAVAANKIFNRKFSERTDPFYVAHKYGAAMEAVIGWHPKNTGIGVPVDVVELKKGGHVSWVQQKIGCQCANPKN